MGFGSRLHGENLNVQNAFSIFVWVRPSRDDIRFTILEITTEVGDVKSSLKISSDETKIYIDLGNDDIIHNIIHK